MAAPKLTKDIEALFALPEVVEEIAVAFEKTDEGVTLRTGDTRATKLVKAKWTYDTTAQSYTAKVQKLIPVDGVVFLKVEHTRPSKRALNDLDAQYSQLLEMRKVADKLQERILKQEKKVIDHLLDNGLKLKPDAPLDAQLLASSKKTRVHYRASRLRIVDRDAFDRLIEDYPVLKKAVVKQTSYTINREALAVLLKDLPESVASTILPQEVYYSLAEYPLKRPGCRFCGGKLSKIKICANCKSPNESE